MPAIIDWAKDTYRFCCRLWGEENIIGFNVHCDETGVHAHVLTVPVERVRKRGRRHKDKVTLEAERQAKLSIAEAEKLKANIEAETAVITQQKEVAQKELKTAQSGFLAKIFQPGKYKNEEATRLKESYNAGGQGSHQQLYQSIRIAMEWRTYSNIIRSTFPHDMG